MNVYLTEEELAKHLGVSRSFLRNARWRGEGPPYFKVGRYVRYDMGDVKGWVDQQKRTSTSDFL